MTELPFSVKYRPKKLSEVIGQHVPVVSVSNAFKEGKMHHAYIFAGNLGCVLGTTNITVRKISDKGVHEIFTE